jgi:parallel beta-helix repeat protein
MKIEFPLTLIAILLFGSFSVVINLETAAAEIGTVYIRMDGSIDPPAAPISNTGNAYYTFIANIYDSIVVERDNIVLDGAGHVLDGPGPGEVRVGIDLTDRRNITIKNATIQEFYIGIRLLNASHNTIFSNAVKDGDYTGIVLSSSSNNMIYENTIDNHSYAGIYLASSSNTIFANILTNNSNGILLYSSANNAISVNHVTNNTDGISLDYSSNNEVSQNTVVNNLETGIVLFNSSSNTIYANTITDNDFYGMLVSSTSNNNVVFANTIKNNEDYGVDVYQSSSNHFFQDNFLTNGAQVLITPGYVNFWDDIYLSNGNYWSDYTGVDANQDGIGDTPYRIDANNVDNYPTMTLWTIQKDYHLVVRGSNNGIYYRSYNASEASWGSWSSLPGLTNESPAAAVIGNELHLVVRGMNGGQIWHGYVNLFSNDFLGWTLLDGSTPSPPTLTANSTHLCLTVRGNNNIIYYRFYDIASRIWSAWSSVPNGSTLDTPGTILVDDALQIVVQGEKNNQIWHGTVNLAMGTFSGWTLLSGSTPSPPMLTGNDLGLCLIVRGINDGIYCRWYDLASEVWSEWVNLPFGTTPDVPAATISGNDLSVVVRGSNYNQIWHGILDLATGEWSDWTLLDGSTPSKPVLTS